MRQSDETEIRDLLARYADAVNRRDTEAWGDTWAEDGCWRILGMAPEGRAAVVALWQKLMAGIPFVLQLPGQALIEVDGDEARCRVYLSEYGRSADGAGLLTLGVYHDRLRREPAGWRFRERRFEPLYSGAPDLSGPLPETVDN